AQEELSVAGSQFSEVSRAHTDVSLAATTLRNTFLPTEEDVAKMQALANAPAPEPVALADASSSAAALFGLEMDENMPLGQRLIAMGLLVAGQSKSVKIAEGKVSERFLA